MPGTATSYTDRGLNDSTVYTYRVIAENLAGRSSASNSADATTLAQPAQVPGMPTGIGAASRPGAVRLSWQAPLFNGGSPIIRYEYRYKLATATSYTMGFRSAMLELMVDVMPLTPGTEYDFEVRAVNSVGPGEAANTDGITDTALRTPGPTAPTAVPRLRTTLGTHAGTTADERHESNAAITVSWDALGPTVNGGTQITGYELCYKKSTDSAWMRWDTTGAAFGTPTLTGSVYSAVHGADAQDALLDPGTTYQYRARALNSVATAGDAATCTHWDGDWSAVTAATTPVVAPNAPTLHPAAGAEGQAAWTLNVNSITIRWTPPTVNGGTTITSYEVWVGTEMVADDSDLGPTVTNLPASRTEYISIGLTASTPGADGTRTYYYRVRARNGSGADRVSEWSDEISGATTQSETGTPGAPASAPTHTVTQATGNVAVVWTVPADQGTSPITGYEVQYQRTDDFADGGFD